MTDNYLYGGMIRLHILHHANDAPVYGLGIVEELRHHGYEISSGTLYPLLHGLEKKGYLNSYHQPTGHRDRRMYEITVAGLEALTEAKKRWKICLESLLRGLDL